MSLDQLLEEYMVAAYRLIKELWMFHKGLVSQQKLARIRDGIFSRNTICHYPLYFEVVLCNAFLYVSLPLNAAHIL